jgi:hypothetical protein
MSSVLFEWLHEMSALCDWQRGLLRHAFSRAVLQSIIGPQKVLLYNVDALIGHVHLSVSIVPRTEA